MQAVGHVARAGEHHVLEQVREPGAADRSFLEPTLYQTFTATVGVVLSCDRITVRPFGSV